MDMHPPNPFSTRFVRPGALAYQFPEGASAQQMVHRLRENGWWGQIVGPHGSGKSTLLHTLVSHLPRQRRHTVWCTMQAGQRRLPSWFWHSRHAWGPRSLVIVDGYEQLGWWARTTLKRRCRRTRAGLLVTSHRDAALPLLCVMPCSEATVQQLVQWLVSDPADAGEPPDRSTAADFCPAADTVSRDDVSRCYRRWQGNVREVFFSLYDLYESRRPER